jgi:tetratricopeptide (TPR) repeat protein
MRNLSLLLALVFLPGAALGQTGTKPSNPPAPAPATNSDDSSSARRLPKPAAQPALDRAQDLLFRKKDPAASIEEFKKALKADPWYAQSYVLLGLAYMQLQRWGDAQWAFEEATKVEPGNAQGYLGWGSALNEQKDYAGAEKALQRSLELDPESAEAHYELARTFGAMGKWEAAGPHAQRAIELNSDYAGPHALMGNVYLDQQDLESARKEFKEYLRLDPEGSLAPQVKQLIAQIEKTTVETPKKRP